MSYSFIFRHADMKTGEVETTEYALEDEEALWRTYEIITEDLLKGTVHRGNDGGVPPRKWIGATWNRPGEQPRELLKPEWAR